MRILKRRGAVSISSDPASDGSTAAHHERWRRLHHFVNKGDDDQLTVARAGHPTAIKLSLDRFYDSPRPKIMASRANPQFSDHSFGRAAGKSFFGMMSMPAIP